MAPLPPEPAAAAASSRTPHFDRSRQAAPQIFDHLRERIIALELPPGSSLSRVELAARFGFSQTPVRDALNWLAEEGLVQVFAQHKTVVSRIDLRAARQAQFLRRSVELEVARILAARADSGLVGRLRASIARQEIASERADLHAFVAEDRAFHREMYAAADVAGLFDIVRRQSGHLDRLRQLHAPEPGKTQAVVADHVRIVEAIARANAADARAAVEAHLSGTLSWIEGVRANFPDYIAG